MSRANEITRALRDYDYKLYCDKNKEGKLCVYRKSHRVEAYDLGEGKILNVVKDAPHFIFALTHNWKSAGDPVPWGVLPILERLQKADLWKNDLAEKCIQETEAFQAEKNRERHNHVESMLIEDKSKYAKMFSDINTGSMNKNKKRKQRIKES